MEMTRQLSEAVFDARARTLALVADLSDDQLFGPRLPTVNPLHWEIGHIGWFQESWILRHALGRPPIREDGDRLYDSSAIPHDVRWDLALPSRGQTIDYLLHTRDLVQKQLSRPDFPESARYFVHLTIAHEDMHDEAIILTRQTLGYPPPAGLASLEVVPEGELAPGDAEIPAGSFLLGSAAGEEVFIHDNEKWAHSVDLDAFAIARAPVTQAEFAHFVDSGGYREPAYWSEPGWQWRSLASAEHPVYWRRSATGWQRRHFDQWKALEPRGPMVHVNWFEAEAYCRFAGRRLLHPQAAVDSLRASADTPGAANIPRRNARISMELARAASRWRAFP
jgi:iron(II)-dependent oxidoreductase